MPSRRYYIGMAPFEHMNGKLARVADKVTNTTDSTDVRAEGFYYGYKLAARPNISRFAFRCIRRDLNAKPYTADELTNRTLFADSLAAVNTHAAIAADWALMLADFARQTDYINPRGYAVAACRSNGGVWLDEWTA